MFDNVFLLLGPFASHMLLGGLLTGISAALAVALHRLENGGNRAPSGGV
jgi:hypothetical protein